MEKKNYPWAGPFNLGVSQYDLKEWDAATSAFKGPWNVVERLKSRRVFIII
jgi:hypothetical protein